MIIPIHPNDLPLIIIFEDVKKKLIGAIRHLGVTNFCEWYFIKLRGGDRK
jgi:hypothetical protein